MDESADLELEVAELLQQLENVQTHNRLKYEYEEPVSLTCRRAGLDEKDWYDHIKSGKIVSKGPYPWQEEFHRMGSQRNHRAIIAANQVGKTMPTGAEFAYHATGDYPDWWEGKRLSTGLHGLVLVACGQTNEELRNIVQKSLFGGIEHDGASRRPSGTGWIPKDRIIRYGFRQCGVPDVLDTVTVRHVSGRKTTIMLKSYEQGPLKFQGFEADVIWFDEEPEDSKIYSEAVTRLIKRRGIFMFSRTPLFGASDIVLTFLNDETKTTWWIGATWDDAPHLDDAAKEELLELYPEFERDTRSKGSVLMGSGAVYPVRDEDIVVDPFEIPEYFRRIVGIDFGIDHPAAGVWLAHDADQDIVYVTDCYRMSGQTAAYHADAIKERGAWIPVSWPHDGMIRDKGGGVQLATQYEEKGVNILGMSARYEDDVGGGQATEPVIMEILGRMRTGRFKVFSTCRTWLLEKGLYHRKDGVIVKLRDDIMAGTNYGMMMIRYAETRPDQKTQVVAGGADYDPLAGYSR